MARMPFSSANPGVPPSRTMPCGALVVLLLATAGCAPRQPTGVERTLVYCTPASKPYARCIADALTTVTGPEAILAPMRTQDMLSALAGTQSGDLVVSLRDGTVKALDDLGLVRNWSAVGRVSLSAVSRTERTLSDIRQPGIRVGCGKPNGALAAALDQLLTPSERALVANNVAYRSDRCSELMRLVRLDALDAAFIWSRPSLPEGLCRVGIPVERQVTCDVLVGVLSCSRKPARALRRLQSAWCGKPYGMRLADLGVARQRTGNNP